VNFTLNILKQRFMELSKYNTNINTSNIRYESRYGEDASRRLVLLWKELISWKPLEFWGSPSNVPSRFLLTPCRLHHAPFIWEAQLTHKEIDIHVIGTNDCNVIPRMHLRVSSFFVSSIYIGFDLRPFRYVDLRSIDDWHKVMWKNIQMLSKSDLQYLINFIQ
jgi:hypothetical protein